MTRTRLIRLGLLSACVFAALGCSPERAGAPAANAAPGERKVGITVAQAGGRDVQRSVQVVGTLMAQDEVTLANEVPATVARILADMGDRVQKGQVLIK